MMILIYYFLKVTLNVFFVNYPSNSPVPRLSINMISLTLKYLSFTPKNNISHFFKIKISN